LELSAHRPSNVEAEGVLQELGMSVTSLLGPRGCLFTFHRVAPSALWKTLPNRNFYIDLEFFDRLLIYLRRAGWEIVTIEEALARARRADPKDRYVNFSVDDGYRDTYELVIPLFRRHGVPVTLYVTTGIPDGKMSMWWAGLEETLLLRDRVIVKNHTIDVQTVAAKRQAYSQIERAWTTGTNHYEAFCAQNDVDAEAVHWRHAISWQMLANLRNDPFVEIGSHGSMHLRISTLQSSDALAELKGGRERLAQRIGVDARHFACPYGRSGDCGPRDFELAREAGFCSAATTRKGVIRGQQDPFRLPRNTLNGAHRNLAMIELHLNGITGAAARMLDRV
jgi:peptidoglycan/xylan/chitin deacetylase (PgdA/CDA1 family)